MTGGTLTGNLTLKYPNKLRGGGNGQQDSDWLAYDNSSNFFTVGNTGTVTEFAAAGTAVYRKNSGGTRYKIYDEGNPAVTEIPLTFSDVNAGVSNLTGYYLKESAAHGRIFVRFSMTATVSNWTTLFKITNADIPQGSAVGNRLGITTTMGQSGYNGSSCFTVCLNSTNGVMCGQSVSATWDYTAIIFI